MSDQQQKPERKYTLLDSPKLRLVAQNPNVPNKYANLKFGIYNGMPRVVVSTNDPSEQQNPETRGMITAAMEPGTFWAMMEELKVAIDSPTEYKFMVNCKTRGKNSPEPVHVADIVAGKDAEGVIFISVIDKKFPERVKIKFPFGMVDPKFHSFVRANGEKFTKQELSVAYAKGYVRNLTDIMNTLMTTSYVHQVFVPGQFGNKGGGGGGWKGNNNNGGGGWKGNNSGYNGGGGSSAPASAPDEDLPF
jgi:uncharacterized membrane protein YgcG